ncbi:hypothetical protein [Mycobacterium sp. E2479]|uniref:hypothetical protein n=1 Tax=Mycobacterium sp. E2479 TaxID=1834134 RepID=UPI00080186D7|nr:hypothetical protein [Mycobacterium sp. E2479]OBH55407.1 hypothetical protein A5686_06045 [Mycobacterium sp. E2479]
MTEVAGIKGTALDTRIKHSMLTDPVLQAELTGDEFRAFVNLTCFVVSLVSDGAFNGLQAELLVPHLDRPTLHRFVALGLIEADDDANCLMAGERWQWQSTREQIERMAKARRDNAERQAEWRKRKARDLESQPPWGTGND